MDEATLSAALSVSAVGAVAALTFSLLAAMAFGIFGALMRFAGFR